MESELPGPWNFWVQSLLPIVVRGTRLSALRREVRTRRFNMGDKTISMRRAHRASPSCDSQICSLIRLVGACHSCMKVSTALCLFSLSFYSPTEEVLHNTFLFFIFLPFFLFFLLLLFFLSIFFCFYFIFVIIWMMI